MSRATYPAATPLGACRLALEPHFGRVPPVWEVASAVGVPPSTWARLERLGSPLPSGRTLAQLTTGLRRLGLPVTPVHLLGYAPIPAWTLPGPTVEADAALVPADLAPAVEADEWSDADAEE